MLTRGEAFVDKGQQQAADDKKDNIPSANHISSNIVPTFGFFENLSITLKSSPNEFLLKSKIKIAPVNNFDFYCNN